MDTNTQFKLIEIKPRISVSLAFILMAHVYVWLTVGLLAGLLFSIITAGVLFLSQGYIIDKEAQKIRKMTWFLGLTWGKWYDLPPIKYVSLLRVRQGRKGYQFSSAMFVQKKSNARTYQINLIPDEARPKPFHLKSTSRDKAIEEGLALGEFLDLKVLDFTTPEKKWIR